MGVSLEQAGGFGPIQGPRPVSGGLRPWEALGGLGPQELRRPWKALGGLRPWKALGGFGPQEALGLGRHQEVLGGLKRPQAWGGLRRPCASGGIGRPWEASGGLRRPQEALGLWRSQASGLWRPWEALGLGRPQEALGLGRPWEASGLGSELEPREALGGLGRWERAGASWSEVRGASHLVKLSLPDFLLCPCFELSFLARGLITVTLYLLILFSPGTCILFFKFSCQSRCRIDLKLIGIVPRRGLFH